MSKKQSKHLERIAVALEDQNRLPRGRDSSTPDRKDMLPIMGRIRVALQVSDNKSNRARAGRRSFPIMGYVGPNGGGKSLAMVQDTLPSMSSGRTVLSTVRLLLPGTDVDHPSYVPFTSFDQLLEVEHCDVLMDEVVGIAGSREASRLDVRVQNILVQLRRRDVVLRWSAPSWARADKIIREVTQSVTECRGYYQARAGVDDNGERRLWAPKRLFAFRTYDTMEFDEWTAGKRERADPQISEWFLGPGSTAFAAYDTMDSVQMVAAPNPEGTCDTCGGIIPAASKRRCQCGSTRSHRPAETYSDAL